jgi:hypothetical protein
LGLLAGVADRHLPQTFGRRPHAPAITVIMSSAASGLRPEEALQLGPGRAPAIRRLVTTARAVREPMSSRDSSPNMSHARIASARSSDELVGGALSSTAPEPTTYMQSPGSPISKRIVPTSW